MQNIFKNQYPDLCNRLEKAADDAERYDIYHNHILSLDKVEQGDFITLLPEKRAKLIDSSGSQIKDEVKSLVDGLNEI